MPFRFITKSIHTYLIDYPVAIVLMVRAIPAEASTHFSWIVSRDSRYGWYLKQEKSTFRGKIARCLRRVAARR